MDTSTIRQVSSDRPLYDPGDDRLGYAPFAEHMADSLLTMIPAQGLVVALYGAWGAGKSTCLSFIEHYLRRSKHNEDQMTIVKFNPWWFSGQQDLAMQFFNQLLATISALDPGSEDLRKRLADFAQLVSRLPIPYAWTGEAVADIIRPEGKDIFALKDEVEQHLASQPKRLLVIIDDIDRLTAEEIRQLFRVIKAVANFPNVTYLLAFDKSVAVRALRDAQNTSGEAYLEKIVQVPRELPLPDETLIRKMLAEKLEAISAGTPPGLFDQERWSSVFWEGVDHFISTPREVVRLTNTLLFTYPGLRGEVNLVDFIALTSLEVFCPAVHDIIRKSSAAFAGHSGSIGFFGKKAKDLKPFHDAWLETVSPDRREAVQNVTQAVFPKRPRQ